MLSLYVAKKLIFNKKHSYYFSFAGREVFFKDMSDVRGRGERVPNSDNIGLKGGRGGV